MKPISPRLLDDVLQGVSRATKKRGLCEDSIITLDGGSRPAILALMSRLFWTDLRKIDVKDIVSCTVGELIAITQKKAEIAKTRPMPEPHFADVLRGAYQEAAPLETKTPPPSSNGAAAHAGSESVTVTA